MDTSYLFSLIQELTYVLVVFGGFFIYSILKGRQAVINVVTGLYVALLVSFVFPYYDTFLGAAESAHSVAVGKLVLFAIFTVLGTILMARLMPDEFREKKFESISKKLLLALGGTIAVMVFSFHVLPVTELLSPGTPVQTLFGNEGYFFWWLLVPLVVLYLN